MSTPLREFKGEEERENEGPMRFKKLGRSFKHENGRI